MRISDSLNPQQQIVLLHLLEDYLLHEILPEASLYPLAIRRAFARVTQRIRGDNPAVSVSTDVDPYTFDIAWDLYQKKVGCKSKLIKKWNKLSQSTRKQIIDYIPLYVSHTPDKKYRKNFETFLNNESWNDELINNGTEYQRQSAEQQQLTASAQSAVDIILDIARRQNE